ncbi:phage portal protein [Companilactobacillus metriopterae]|uniref:phage portal protein n=1 Tax=Companilactobacillus metriopterae TaxID=1909267 RepID=UPI00100B6A41|nr:phage portal protein [Companilactobacillus metriopterae]
MGIFTNIFSRQEKPTVTPTYQMVVSEGNGFFSWNGNLYKSDIIRSIVRTKSSTVGKAVAKHLKKDSVDPDYYMRELLKYPNPLMTGQMLQEKLTSMLELNNNAFAVIVRDSNGLGQAIYPISSATSFEGIIDKQGNVYVRFFMRQGDIYTFRYSDLIHLRKDYTDNEIFGTPINETISALMDVVEASDKGIIKAVQNSNAVRWLLQYNTSSRPEDVTKGAQEFAKAYLSTESESFGVAAVDAKAEAKQVQVNPYVPGKDQLENVTDRIYSLFNINKNILQASYTENQWISFYESQIEPILKQLSDQFTLKLFNPRQRQMGNSIIFESSSMTFASMQTKLSLAKFVEDGIMNANEVRSYFNLSPRDGGDEYVLRKDTERDSEHDDNQKGGGIDEETTN